jgi:hypothetical protein
MANRLMDDALISSVTKYIREGKAIDEGVRKEVIQRAVDDTDFSSHIIDIIIDEGTWGGGIRGLDLLLSISEHGPKLHEPLLRRDGR